MTQATEILTPSRASETKLVAAVCFILAATFLLGESHYQTPPYVLNVEGN